MPKTAACIYRTLQLFVLFVQSTAQFDASFLTNLAQFGANLGNFANTVNNLNQAFGGQAPQNQVPQQLLGLPIQPIQPVIGRVPQRQAAILPLAPQPYPDDRPQSPLANLQFPTQLDQIVRQENFGIKKGEGCIPVLGDVVRVLFANCQQRADSQQLQSWGGHLNGAIAKGQIDVLSAAKDTCRLQAERNNCQQLVDRVATCDIIGSLAMANQLEQAKQRCNQLTLLALNPPKQQNQVVDKLTNFIGSEVAHNLLQNFLG